MNRPLLTIALAASLWPLSAAAQQAFTMASVDVYAGPSSEYPRVALLPANTPVHVDGCLADWSWCDVDFSGDRGWVYAGDLGYPYENRRVVILDDGAHLGLPVLSFSLNSYWDAHYRNRPWFAQREDWQRRVSVQGDHRGGQAPAGRAAGATIQQGNMEQQGNVEQRGIGERGNVDQSQPRTSQPPTEPESRMQPQPQPQAEPQRRPQSQPQPEEQTTRQQEAQPGKSRPEGESRAKPEPDRTQSPDASARRSRGEESRDGGAESATSTTLPSNSSADRARSGDQGGRQPDRNDRSDGG